MSNVVDVPRLIAEVHKRPALWDVRHGDNKARHCIPKLWQEVAQNVGIDVEQCKRKWKNLRDAYRAEVRRSERRIERDKLMGIYDPNTNYNSKWIYFSSLSFVRENKRNSNYSVENENNSSNSNDNQYDETYNDSVYDENFPGGHIKLEPSHNMDEDLNLADDDDAANDMLFEEFQNIATPQAARRLSETLSMNNPMEQTATEQQVPVNTNKPSTSKVNDCKCSERADEQVNFLENLGREELKLMKSTKHDITRSNKFDHIGDSDYNFLVSFLPQMKKMSELQNLQFRAKMCEIVLNIFAPTVAGGDSRHTSALQLTDEHSKQQAANESESINSMIS